MSRSLKGSRYSVVETFNSVPNEQELDNIAKGLNNLKPDTVVSVSAYITYNQILIALKVVACVVAGNSEVQKKVVSVLRMHQPTGDVMLLTNEQKPFLVHSMLLDEQGINIDDDVPLTEALLNLIKDFVVYAKSVLDANKYAVIRRAILDEVQEQTNVDVLVSAMDAVAPLDWTIQSNRFNYTYPVTTSSTGDTSPQAPAASQITSKPAAAAPQAVHVPVVGTPTNSSYASSSIGLTGNVRIAFITMSVIISAILVFFIILSLIKMKTQFL